MAKSSCVLGYLLHQSIGITYHQLSSSGHRPSTKTPNIIIIIMINMTAVVDSHFQDSLPPVGVLPTLHLLTALAFQIGFQHLSLFAFIGTTLTGEAGTTRELPLCATMATVDPPSASIRGEDGDDDNDDDNDNDHKSGANNVVRLYRMGEINQTYK